jgi:hypothetical protein
MVTRTQQMGKAVILVAQGPRDDLERQELPLLLICWWMKAWPLSATHTTAPTARPGCTTTTTSTWPGPGLLLPGGWCVEA